MVAHIGKRHIISLKKRQSGIVIFKIQGIPHPFRHLVDEAENAFISAGPVLIHQAGVKLQPDLLVRVLLDLQFPLLSVRLLDKEQEFLILRIKLIVKYILYFLSVDGQKSVSGPDAQFICNASRDNPRYNMFMVFHNPVIYSSSDSCQV